MHAVHCVGIKLTQLEDEKYSPEKKISASFFTFFLRRREILCTRNKDSAFVGILMDD